MNERRRLSGVYTRVLRAMRVGEQRRARARINGRIQVAYFRLCVMESNTAYVH